MINLSRFSRMSFAELESLPNYKIHTIYKLFVTDAIERQKKQEEEAKLREQQAKSQANNQNQQFAGNMMANRDNQNVANLREMLSGQVNDNDLEDLLEEIEDGG